MIGWIPLGMQPQGRLCCPGAGVLRSGLEVLTKTIQGGSRTSSW